MPVTRKIFTLLETMEILAHYCNTHIYHVRIYNNDQLELNDHMDNRVLLDKDDFLFQVDSE